MANRYLIFFKTKDYLHQELTDEHVIHVDIRRQEFIVNYLNEKKYIW